ncbi:MAG TPA: hydrogenase maturation nickel metallochaperone HypA [Thermoanaerobacterales bacterium]|nr:hydrogenase maturation nickel metallochaperone HypA [Thermoanaerobacterales bacterium]
MHELSITEDILRIALSEIDRSNYKKITKLNIIIGDLSGVTSENIKYYFEILSKDTPASDAILKFKYSKSKFQCNKCNQIYERCNFSILCPHCNSSGVIVESHTSLYIESLEVE